MVLRSGYTHGCYLERNKHPETCIDDFESEDSMKEMACEVRDDSYYSLENCKICCPYRSEDVSSTSDVNGDWHPSFDTFYSSDTASTAPSSRPSLDGTSLPKQTSDAQAFDQGYVSAMSSSTQLAQGSAFSPPTSFNDFFLDSSKSNRDEKSGDESEDAFATDSANKLEKEDEKLWMPRVEPGEIKKHIGWYNRLLEMRYAYLRGERGVVPPAPPPPLSSTLICASISPMKNPFDLVKNTHPFIKMDIKNRKSKSEIYRRLLIPLPPPHIFTATINQLPPHEYVEFTYALASAALHEIGAKVPSSLPSIPPEIIPMPENIRMMDNTNSSSDSDDSRSTIFSSEGEYSDESESAKQQRKKRKAASKLRRAQRLERHLERRRHQQEKRSEKMRQCLEGNPLIPPKMVPPLPLAIPHPMMMMPFNLPPVHRPIQLQHHQPAPKPRPSNNNTNSHMFNTHKTLLQHQPRPSAARSPTTDTISRSSPRPSA
ncbi:unnamed protein product [Caenorhabditis auriculariae]|uniref:Uncharacterized protein n=1 Tax=Caenorhabditis auriculariae TaxID=2777116 RepID=A0A8S1H727_9PELO|nr:unnamed protein product [Caenorhabditis auriculariae]